ncbi:MAG: PP2C family protein-serine/threonine phosphatase [Candidatus Aminicenantes bacterium]
MLNPKKKKSIFKRASSFILNIGGVPEDSEYIRLVKRIYYGGSLFSLPLSVSISLLYFMRGDIIQAAIMLFSFVFFCWFMVNGALFPQNFERNATYLVFYFVLVPFLITFLKEGIWNANGAIYIGLMGPIFALLLPNKRKALLLFGLYVLLVIVIVLFQPYFADSIAEITGFRLFIFWYGFLIIATFVFGSTYFFVLQRDKAYRLLGIEKEKSERLLRRIEKDLEQAAKIQRDLLPKEDPNLEGFDIVGTNIPCYQVGGDYYDFIPIDDDRLGVIIADVSGKGISASLLMASLRAALLAEVHAHYDIQEMVGRLNDFVYRSSPISSFITFFLCEINRQTGELKYINAGHNPPLVIKNSGGFSCLESSGFALGMFPEENYELGKIQLKSEDVAVLFTDGIPEGRNTKQEEYSDERLKDLAIEMRNLTASKLSANIFEDVEKFTAGAEQADDITLVVIKRSK